MMNKLQPCGAAAPRKTIKHTARTAGAALAVLSGLLAGCGGSDDPSDALACAAAAPLGDGPGGRLFAAADADMIATAVIDNRLDPAQPGVGDAVFLIDPSGATPTIANTASIPNSVTGPVWVVATNRSGSRGYVVETHVRSQGVNTRPELLASPSNRLTTLDLCSRRIAALSNVATANGPTTVSLRADGTTLAVSGSLPARLVLHRLDAGGVPGPAVEVALPADALPPADAPAREQEITFAGWSPDGRMLAVAIRQTRRIVLMRAGDNSVSGVPALTVIGQVSVDEGPFGGAWSPDSRFFYANNIKLLARPLGEVIAGPGAGLPPPQLAALLGGSLQVIAIDEPDADGMRRGPKVVQAEATPMFPEGMNISPDGRYVGTVNILATPLPRGSALYSPQASISLWSRDGASGRLTKLGDTPFEGILPEGAAFDPTSRFLAVAVFEAGDTDRTAGAVDLWRIAPGAQPPLQRHARVRTPRGTHALAWLP